MKKQKINGLAVLFTAGWLLVTAPFVVSVGGCKTANQVAYKTTATVQVTADFAMRAWGEYVRLAQPGVEKELAVRNAFNKYRAALIVVTDAGRRYTLLADEHSAAGLDFALAASSAALIDLVNLIQTFGVKLK